MRSVFWLGSWSSIVVAGVIVLAFPGIAAARSCKVDGDCPKGFQCAGDGVDGNEMCVVTSCESDADCGPALRCMLNAVTQCTGGPETCHPVSYCEPEWQVPCVADSDCGPGFSCTGPGSIFECGHGADAAAPPSYATAERIPCSAVPKPPLPGCNGDAGCPIKIPSICQPGTSCVELKWKTCEQETTGSCKVDSDCPSTWTCDCRPALTPVSSPEKDAGTTPCTHYCAPPNEDLSNGGVGPIYGAPAMSVSAPHNGAGEVGAPPAPTESGGPQATPAGSSSSASSSPSPSPSSRSPSSPSSSTPKNESGACSIRSESGSRNGLLGVVMALGASALMRRRRRIRRR